MLAEEYGLFRILFILCGGIGWVLWGISVLTVTMIVQYFITIRRSNILPDLVKAEIQSLFESKQYREVIDLTVGEPSFLSYIMHGALSEAAHGYAAMERALEEAAEERTTRLLRSVEWLNLIGNIGPMLGLLGTVWGMITVFFEIVAAGGMPDVGLLAKGIGTALVTTLLGLSVAIPALAVYAIMRNRIDGVTAEAMVAAQEMIGVFRPTKKTS